MRKIADRICVIEGCEKKKQSKGLCSMHYARKQRHGDPQVTLRPRGILCEILGCENVRRARGLCSLHYCRWYKDPSRGPIDITNPRWCVEANCNKPAVCHDRCNAHYHLWLRANPMVHCSIEWCSKQSDTNGLCGLHFMRFKRHGDPLKKVKLNCETPEYRFDLQVNKMGPIPDSCPELGRCWVWEGSVDRSGYGTMASGETKNGRATYVRVHRWSYEKSIGEIPEGLQINHRCFNPPCVRPSHLNPVTHRQNIIEFGLSNAAFINKNRTHCKRGHLLSPDNLYIQANGSRICKQCHKVSGQEYRLRKKLGIKAIAKVANKTGYHGVSERNVRGVTWYIVTTGFEGRSITIGTFRDLEEAARAYDKRAFELHGESFSYFNFPDELKMETEI